MKHKLMSLGLGIALSLGILLFMATLVEPPGGEKATTEQKSIVINMQNEVTEVQVRERPVPQEPEPLPENSRLWKIDTAVITPHVSGGYHLHETHERIVGICAENLRRFLAGEQLKNTVDFTTGYRKLQ